MAHLTEGARDVFLVEPPWPTYTVPFTLAPTAAMDLVSINCPAGRRIRIRQIFIDSSGTQTTAGTVTVPFGYASAVGTGGSAATPGNYGIGDGFAASGCTARTGDTTVAANFVQVGALHVYVPQAAPVFSPVSFVFHPDHRSLCLAGDQATADTFVLRHPGETGAADFSGSVEYTEEYV